MKKIMIYCQHLAGMGHLVRCREIIRSLAPTFKICFVSGGQMVSAFELPRMVEVVQLPGLRQKGAALIPLDETTSLEEIKAQRKQMLLDIFDRFQPDCLITECFPFSKMSMKYELSPLLKKAKSSLQTVKIICSLRDLIMTQPLPAEEKIRRIDKVCRLINRFYDAVLLHADANFQRIEGCFPRASDLTCEIIYTGYVAQSPSNIAMPTPEDITAFGDLSPMIVVSAGGGRHGYPLLNAMMRASPLLTHQLPHQIHAFAGPFMPEEDFLTLQQAAAKLPNVTLQRYTPLLIDYLNKADLSVSLGGYNTTMNLLRTRVRSLLLPSLNPSQTDEQRIRAEKLAHLGVLTLLTPQDLRPQRLAEAIITALHQTPTSHQIDLQGAAKTASYLQKLLTEKSALVEAA
ncbi:MAG: glycosyltransferase [Cyanobacteria bacterium P01_F01_bin.53]